MSKYLRALRCALLTVTLLFLSSAPIRAQQIQLEVANAVVTKNLIGEAAISITLSPESGRAFAAFSKDVAGRFIEIRSAGDVLASLRLQTSIEGGTFQFFVRDSDVTEVARKLSENAARLEIRVLEEKK
jgi:hypothetical protein